MASFMSKVLVWSRNRKRATGISPDTKRSILGIVYIRFHSKISAFSNAMFLAFGATDYFTAHDKSFIFVIFTVTLFKTDNSTQ